MTVVCWVVGGGGRKAERLGNDRRNADVNLYCNIG
jgi:hypothetical protein